jgi:hypothetical protein
MPLSKEVGGFEFTMEIDIDKAEGVSESTIKAIKDKEKETVSQIGARVTKDCARKEMMNIVIDLPRYIEISSLRN